MDTEDIIGYEALYNSMMKCKKGVMWKDSTAFFVHNWMREIRKLERQLHDGTYQERSPKFFKVMEPKEREIMSIAFRDRVYQRSLNDVGYIRDVRDPLFMITTPVRRGKVLIWQEKG